MDFIFISPRTEKISYSCYKSISQKRFSAVFLGGYFISHRATLHCNDWLMSITPVRGSGQTSNIFCISFHHDSFKRKSRNMVALIYNNLAIILNSAVYSTFFIQTLEHCNIYNIGCSVSSSTNLPYIFNWQRKKRSNLCAPLFKKRLAMTK